MPTLNANEPKKLVLTQLDAESQIKQLKEFYKTYVSQVNDVRLAIADLREIIPLSEELNKASAMGQLLESNIKIATKIESTLKKHFAQDFIDLYKKDVAFDDSRELLKVGNHDSAFRNLIEILNATIQGMEKKHKLKAEYQTKLLKHTEFCLLNYGLHPLIEQRDEKKYKKFNLLVKHKTHSRTVIEDYKVLLNWSNFHNEFVEYYKKRLPIKIGGKIIQFDKIVEVKITTTKIHDTDELHQFFRKRGIPLTDKESNEKNLIAICNDETERFSPNPYAKEVEAVSGNDVKATKFALVDFPSALKLFNQAAQKYGDPTLSRNCLDDLRLCLETLLREKLKNSKSLENQTQALGKYIKDKGGSTEVTDLLHKVIEFYWKYQNNNVKHNDNTKPGDVKFIFNLTSTLIIHLSEV